MPHSMCDSGARWCVRADAILDVPDMHVLDVQIGMDEHIWRPSRIGVDRAVTIMVELFRTRPDACTPGSSTPSSAALAVSTWAG